MQIGSNAVLKPKGAVFRAYPLLYHKFGNMVILRSGKNILLYSLGNQDYQKSIDFFTKKGRDQYHDSLILIKILFLHLITSISTLFNEKINNE